MSRTRTQLRQEVARQLGLPFFSGTSTASSATTLTQATELGRFPNDHFNGAYLYLPDATVKHRTITDFVQSTGVLTFIPSDSGGTDGTDSYEVLPFPADAIHDAINQALLMLYDEGALVRKGRMVAVAGSPIYNADFSYWTDSTTLDGWTGATVTKASDPPWAYGSALSITTGTHALNSTYARYLMDIAPGSAILHTWASSSSTSNEARLMENGVEKIGLALGDTGDPQLVSSASTALTNTETDFNINLVQASGTPVFYLVWLETNTEYSTAYPDLHPFPVALMPDGPSEITWSYSGIDTDYKRAPALPRRGKQAVGWEWLRIHETGGADEVGLVRWNTQRPPQNSILQVYYNGPHTLPTTDAGIVELDQMEGILVAKTAAMILLQASPLAGSPRWGQKLSLLAADVERLAGNAGRGYDSAALGPTW